jgi:hypothetical protein
MQKNPYINRIRANSNEFVNGWFRLEGRKLSNLKSNNKVLEISVKVEKTGNISEQGLTLKLRCDTRFQRVFTACGYVFKVITLVGL